MTREEIRLRCIELATPVGITNPDIEMILKRAAAYVRFVGETGSTAPANTNADTGVTVKASSPDTSKEPGKPRRQKQTA